METWIGLGRPLAWLAVWGVAAYYFHAETLRSGPPAGARAYTDVAYRRVGARVARLDVYLPRRRAAAPAGFPAVVAIHGGGWHGGTKNSYGRDVARLAQYGCAVISVDYLLSSPGHPSWPENLEDVRAAVRWIHANACDYGIDNARIAALGSSAGGHLAALLGLDAGSADSACRVAAVVDFYGPTDLVALYRVPKAVPSLDLYLGSPPDRRPDVYREASPIRHVSPRAAAMLMIHGADDPLVPVEQSVDLAARLQAVGVLADLVVVPGAGHSFGFEIDQRDLVPVILGFLDSAWGASSRIGQGTGRQLR